ncbi:MAG TPA: uroporphyrinogen decarboxylase family protein [bacterium]|nr:uroporphyrinogen decarboxylase family protein [bacterium]HPN35920.1 uroporphyrinogen decarboxylase family protein [bacterium]
MTTSKARVVASLQHQTSDKIPVDFGATAVTGIHYTCVAALREHYGLEKRPVKVHEPYQMLGWIDEDLMQAMGIDVQGVIGRETLFGFVNENWKPFRMDNGLEILVSEHFKTTRSENGDLLIYPKGDLSAPPSGRMPKNGFYFDSIIRQPPLREEELDPRDNLEEFTLLTDEDLDYYQREVEAAQRTGRGIIASFGGTALGDIALVPAPFLKYPKGIRDVEEWYISTVTRQDYIHRVFAAQTEIALQNLAKIHARVGDQVDAVFVCGTDFGTQSSTFCSEQTFRSLYLPYYQQINGWIHRHTTWKTFKHACGAILPLLPAMIEAGFDIMNPVQCSAAGMNPEVLKARFGDQLTFWGGGVDTQKTLPFGTPAQVREQVLRRCEIFSKNGGFIFNTVHNIQANTPVENIVTMLETVKNF